MYKWIVLVAIICTICFLEWMREIHTFKMTHYRIQAKKLNGLQKEKKVILLSDLHNYSYGKNNERLLRAIEKEKPDYILVAGDMLVGKPNGSTKVAEDFMTQLPKFCEVYHANGNHEQRMKEEPERYDYLYEQYKEKLEAAGVRFLENEKIDIDWDGIGVSIYGLEIPRESYKKFCANHYELQIMEEQIGIVERSRYNILIAHNPLFIETYLKWGADLVVSGHLHGGVVRLPIIGGVISPQFTLFPKYSGEMKKDIEKDATTVVSKGIGIHTIKVRLFNPAEVVVMHLGGAEE